MISSARAFWGGMLLLIAAGFMIQGGGKIDILPPAVYEKVRFVLLDESSEASPEIAILVNSDKWQDLASRNVSAMRYDVTKDAKKPELEKLLQDLGSTKPPAILVYDDSNGKLVGVEASPSLDKLDSLVKKYTGK